MDDDEHPSSGSGTSLDFDLDREVVTALSTVFETIREVVTDLTEVLESSALSITRAEMVLTELRERQSVTTTSHVSTFGELVAAARERRDPPMTQQAFARAVGVSQQTVSNWEKNKRVPRLPMVEDIARVLGVPYPVVLAAAFFGSSDGLPRPDIVDRRRPPDRRT